MQRAARLLAALGAAFLASSVALGAPGVSWTVSRQPSSVMVASPTRVTVTVTNTSQSVQIGCIQISVPSPAFTVTSTAITRQPAAGRRWTAAPPAPGVLQTVVTASAANGAATLRGGTVRDTVGIGVTVSGVVPGAHPWRATAFADTGCTPVKALGLTSSFSVTVTVLPTPAPTARPAPTSPPPPSGTPEPTASPGASVAPSASPQPSGPSGPAGPVPTASPASGALARGWAGGADDPYGVPVSGAAPIAVDVSTSLGHGLQVLELGVPALALSVPGLLVIGVVLAQVVGGVMWLPLVRRWIGGFGLRRRRDGPASSAD